MKLKIKIISTATAMLIFSGCANSNSNTVLKPIGENNFKKSEHKLLSSKEKIKEFHIKQLKTNGDYITKNKSEAIIENKRDDKVTNKPVFLEPLMVKIEILPRKSNNGLWHEQESVWGTVVNGEIALKTNENTIKRDNIRTILER